MLAGDGIQPAGEAREGLLIGVGVGDLDGTFDRGGGGGGRGIRVFRVARHDVKLLEDVLHAMRPFDPLISDLPPSFFSIAAERSRFLIRFLFLVRSHGVLDAGSSTVADDQRGEGVGWPAQKRSSQWEPWGPTVYHQDKFRYALCFSPRNYQRVGWSNHPGPNMRGHKQNPSIPTGE